MTRATLPFRSSPGPIREGPSWSPGAHGSNPQLSIEDRLFSFTDTEAVRIKAAFETWDGYNAAGDRRWLELLIEAIYSTNEERRGWQPDPKA